MVGARFTYSKLRSTASKSDGGAGPINSIVRVVTLKSVLKMVAMATDVSAVINSRQSTTHIENMGGAWDVDRTAPAMLPAKFMSTTSPAIGLPPRMKTAVESSPLGPSMSQSRGRSGDRGDSNLDLKRVLLHPLLRGVY